MADLLDTATPKQPKDGRGYNVIKRPEKIRLMYGCRDPSHDKIWLFETYSEAHLHEIETQHHTELMQVELEPDKSKLPAENKLDVIGKSSEQKTQGIM